MSDENDR